MIFLLLSSFAQEACKQPFPLLISWAALLPAKSIQDSGRPQICEYYSSSLSTTMFRFPRERKCNTCWLLMSLTWRSKTTLRNICAGAAVHVTAARFLTQFQQGFLRIFTTLNKQKCTVLLGKRSGRTAVQNTTKLSNCQSHSPEAGMPSLSWEEQGSQINSSAPTDHSSKHQCRLGGQCTFLLTGRAYPQFWSSCPAHCSTSPRSLQTVCNRKRLSLATQAFPSQALWRP